jgi:hypothetical protein
MIKKRVFETDHSGTVTVWQLNLFGHWVTIREVICIK